MTQIRGTRPTIAPDSNEVLPPHFEIYNAPRPLYGHFNWTGNFLHGRFYVAIDPDADYADEYRSRTLANNGKLLEWVDDDTAFDRQCEYYLEIYAPKRLEMAKSYIANASNREEIIRAYFRRVNGG